MAGPEVGPRDPRARRLRALLHDAGTRRAESAFVLEGPRLVADALARGAALEAVYLGPGARRAFAELIGQVEDARVAIHDLRDGVLEKLGSVRTPQPVLATAAIPPPVPLAAVPVGLVVVTTDVQDPGNLGTIVRSAEAADARAVIVVRGEQGVDPWNPKVVRGSAGSVLGLPIVAVDDAVGALDALRARGWRTIGTAARATLHYTASDLSGATAIVVGSESHGLPAVIAELLDVMVAIPMAGAVDSLNAGVAASVLLFEAARQQRGDQVN